MKLTRSVEPNPGLMQFAGLLDVVFLLLIFFLLSSQVATQPALAVTLPYSPFTLAPLHKPAIITITGEPHPAIFFRSEKVTMATLIDRLAGLDSRERSMVIKADRTTPVETVVAVTNACLTRGFSVALATSQEGH